MFCENCGKQLNKDSNFCSNCGKKITAIAAPWLRNRNFHPAQVKKIQKISDNFENAAFIIGIISVFVSFFLTILAGAILSEPYPNRNADIDKLRWSLSILVSCNIIAIVFARISCCMGRGRAVSTIGIILAAIGLLFNFWGISFFP